MSNLRWERREERRWKYPRYMLSGRYLNWGYLQFVRGKWVLEVWTQGAHYTEDDWEVRGKFESLDAAKDIGKLLCAAAIANARDDTPR